MTVERESHGRIGHSIDGGDEAWTIELAIEVADTCRDQTWRRVDTVRVVDRKVRGPLVAIPLVAGIAVAAATPAVVYYGSTRSGGVTPDGQPIPATAAPTAIAIGEGIGGALILGGAITIGVTRDGKGHHETTLNTRDEPTEDFGSPAPCGWQPLSAGSGVIAGTSGASLPFEVTNGHTRVALPAPADATDVEFDVLVDGVGAVGQVILIGTEYDQLARVAVADRRLAARDFEGARLAIAGLSADGDRRGEVVQRYRERLGEESDSLLQRSRPSEAADLVRASTGLLPADESRALLAEILPAAFGLALKDVDLRGAGAALLELRENESPRDDLQAAWASAVEVQVLAALDLGSAADAEQLADVVGILEPGLSQAIRERSIARVALNEIDAALAATPPGGPVEVVRGVLPSLAALAELGQADSAVYPEGIEPALDVLAQRVTRALDPARLAKDYRVRWQGLGIDKLPRGHAQTARRREWLSAYVEARSWLAQHPGFVKLGANAELWAADLERFDSQVRAFADFAPSFSRTLAGRDLARRNKRVAAEIGAPEPGWRACRAGRSFVADFGAAAYQDHVKVWCGSRFPSTWFHAQGTSREVSAEVSSRTCTAYFASPAGCD